MWIGRITNNPDLTIQVKPALYCIEGIRKVQNVKYL